MENAPKETEIWMETIPNRFKTVNNNSLQYSRWVSGGLQHMFALYSGKKSILAPWVLDQSIIVTQVSQDHHTTCFMYPCTLPSLTTLRDSGSRPSGMRHRKTPLTQSPSHPGSLLPDYHKPLSTIFSIKSKGRGV